MTTIDKNMVMAKIVFNDGTHIDVPLTPSQVFNATDMLLARSGVSEVIYLTSDGAERYWIENSTVEKIELTRIIIAGGED